MLPDTSRAKVERRIIRITVQGCDDATEVVLDLTESEYAVVRRLADATATASQDACQPVVQVRA